MRTHEFKQKRCPCGSGKKYKNCCGKKKPRAVNVVMDMGKPTVINGVRFTGDKGFELLTDSKPVTPDSARMARTYERSGKNDKVVYEAPVKAERLSWDIVSNLASFDFLIPIDTNTRERLGVRELASTAVCMEYERVFAQGAVDFIPRCVWAWEYKHLAPGLAEKTAWWDLIRLLLRKKGEKNLAHLRIGIVTDHDLANHPKYNGKEIPLIDGSNYFLPPGIELLYASADVVSDSPLNRMVAECDRLSTQGLKLLIDRFGAVAIP